MSHASKFLADHGHHAVLKMREEQAAQRDLENRVRAAHDPVFAAELAKLEAADPSIARRRELQERRIAKAERKAAKRQAQGKSTATTWAERQTERSEKRIADAHAKRADAMATPLSPGMHRAMVVLAVLCALTVVGLPITALIAYMLHAKGKAHAGRVQENTDKANAEAARHLTAEDRQWLAAHDGSS